MDLIIQLFEEYTSYFDAFSFQNEIEQAEIEKFFNYLDMYPSTEEIKDARMNVLKCKQTKT